MRLYEVASGLIAVQGHGNEADDTFVSEAFLKFTLWKKVLEIFNTFLFGLGLKKCVIL